MMNISTLRRALLALALSTCATLVSAATTFHIELNTAHLGNTGWIDVQLGAAPSDPTLTWADLHNFVGFKDPSTPEVVDVTGTLTSGFHMSTVNGWSDLFHEINYANGKVGFDVTIDSNTGVNSSTFTVALFDADKNLLTSNVGADGYSVLHMDWTPPAVAGGSGSLAVSAYDSSLVQITAVPEPSSWLMLGAGLALLGYARRRTSAV